MIKELSATKINSILRAKKPEGTKVFKTERQRLKNKIKEFVPIKEYENYILFEHKKYGYKECFLKADLMSANY